MDRVLLWVSLAVGLVVFLLRFVPVSRGEDGSATAPPASPHPGLRLAALLTPFLGLLVTLPAHGAFFSQGQRLGFGFLIGGIATLLGQISLLTAPRSHERETNAALFLTSSYGMSIAAVSLALFFLRASLFDGLMGIAIGGFAVAFALFLGLPQEARSNAIGRRLVASTGFLVTLATAAALAVFRDPLTPELAKLIWSGIVVAFAALGTLLVAGSSLLPTSSGGSYGRLIPLAVLIGVGGLGLYELTTKLTNTNMLSLIGIGGLFLWPVALAVLRETARRGTHGPTPLLAVPLLAVLVVTSGFLAALQTLQGTGVAIGVLALFLAYPATIALVPSLDTDTVDDTEKSVPTAAVGLLLFSCLLLLWRFFVTRWTGDLRGVNLSDQYALFGLIVGAALPGLLAQLPARWRGGTTASGGSGFLALGATTMLTLAAPAVVLVLFGPKSAVALLIGLAVGAVPTLAAEGAITSLLPGLLAIAVALALDQWTGTVLPDEAPTRVQKIRYLAGLMAAIVVLVIAAARLTNTKDSGDKS